MINTTLTTNEIKSNSLLAAEVLVSVSSSDSSNISGSIDGGCISVEVVLLIMVIVVVVVI